jgi:acyl-CoA thioester hydrolase
MGGWINLTERKLRELPEDLFKSLNSLSKTDDFKILTKEDTRKFGQVPQHLN